MRNKSDHAVDQGLQERLSRNESVFREINEGIQRGQWPGEKEATRFRCECARLGCTELIELTVKEYESVRARGRRFIVARGHENLRVEVVVETFPGYLVVEKRGQAGAAADASDPRGA